jgi:outer membrane protein assembly factor BamB
MVTATLLVPARAAAQQAPQVPPAGAPPPAQAAAPVDVPQPPAWLSPVWTISLPGEPAALPAYDAAQAYVPLRDNRLVALSLTTGEVRWSIDLGVPGAPAAGDGLVFVAAPRAIEARVREDGSVRWRLPIDGSVAGPLLWDQGWLLAVMDSGTAIAIRARDGESIWQRALGAPANVVPSLGPDRAYFPLMDGRVVAVNLRTGVPVWERKLGGPPAQILVLDDRLFVGSADNFFYCLDSSNGGVKWRWRTGGDIIGRPAVDAKSVYFVAADNVMRSLDRGNGNQRWKGSLATRPAGGPLLLDDNLLLVSGIAPQVWAYRKKDGLLAAEAPAPAELAAPPYVAPPDAPGHIRLVIVTGEGHVQALGLAPIGHPVPGLPLFVDLPVAQGTAPPKAGQPPGAPWP